MHDLSVFLGTGDVIYCSSSNDCKTVATGLNYPNGLVRDAEGLIYVPSAMAGYVYVYRPREDHTLEKIDKISIPYGIDNLSIDANGDLWAGAFPKTKGIPDANVKPGTLFPPVTALRIRRTAEGYVWEKILEDVHSKVLPAATTVVHDAKTGRLFLSGEFEPTKGIFA